jgi:actin-like ATPase involved in cell morphogenesis
VHSGSKRVLAVGDEAKRMLGRTPRLHHRHPAYARWRHR